MEDHKTLLVKLSYCKKKMEELEENNNKLSDKNTKLALRGSINFEELTPRYKNLKAEFHRLHLPRPKPELKHIKYISTINYTTSLLRQVECLQEEIYILKERELERQRESELGLSENIQRTSSMVTSLDLKKIGMSRRRTLRKDRDGKPLSSPPSKFTHHSKSSRLMIPEQNASDKPIIAPLSANTSPSNRNSNLFFQTQIPKKSHTPTPNFRMKLLSK
jgi:hypothetical protein